ncbi:MAG: Gfo/Idh/MocA family protein [Pyrinomonadaceae bacterium]
MKINPQRVAIIGLGAASRNIHLPAYKSLAGKVEIVGGCDTDGDARKTWREKFGIGEIFDDPLKMIETTAPDIVSICTPPALHVEQTLLALKHNAHVFCEKPLAENLVGATEIIRAAEFANRFVVVNSQFPYMNIHRAAKRMIGSPEFGRLLFLQAWQIFHPSHNTEAGWRGELKRRLCFDFGVHVFELARNFFGDEPMRISAQMPQPQPAQNFDILNLITLEFADGRAASIILNRLSNAPERYLDMRLDGERASIQTSIGGQVRFEAGIHTREKRPFLGLNFIKGGSAVLQNGNKSKIIAKDGINPFASSTAYHFRNFINAIEQGKTPLATAQDNLKTLALVFAAYDSAESHCAIEMPDYINRKLLAAD